MTQREKILLGAIVGLLVAWFGWRGLGQYQQAMRNSRNELQRITQERASVKLDGMRTLQAMQQLEAWQQQSLPASTQVAQTEYRAWLQNALGDAGLRYSNVRRVGVRPVEDAAVSISFMAHAEGKLGQIAHFLHAFYDLPQLHRLSMLRLTPLEGDRLAMDITADALVVQGTTRTQGMVQGSSGRLPDGDRQHYVESLLSRNLFVAYTPPPPPKPAEPKVVERTPPPPPKPKFDDAKHAYLTAVLGSGQGPQAWINVRTTGKTLYLQPGDEIEVGLFKGRVKSIDLADRRVLIESEGQTLSIGLGAHLREATPAG